MPEIFCPIRDRDFKGRGTGSVSGETQGLARSLLLSFVALFFCRVFASFAPTNCPWVSENEQFYVCNVYIEDSSVVSFESEQNM